MNAAVHRGRHARQGHDTPQGDQMTTQLPFHPTMRHPLTGQPLRALWVDPAGRARYPIMGGAPDDPPEGGSGGGQTDPPQQPQRQAGVPENYAIDREGRSLGYPVETPVARMTDKEAAAYERNQSRRWQQRATEWKDVAGDRDAAKLKADLEELDTLRREKMTDQERREADAEKRGKDAVISTGSRSMAEFALGVALDHVPEERRKVLLESVDPSRVVRGDGSIDTDKVKEIAAALAPKSDKDTRDPDYGGGRHGSSSSTGVSAGRAAFEERRKAKQGRRPITGAS